MNIIDTSDRIFSVFESGRFKLERWQNYMEKWVPGAKELCLEDMRATIDAGYTWENDYLPILQTVLAEDGKRKEIITSFRKITENLEEKCSNCKAENETDLNITRLECKLFFLISTH